MCSPSHVGCHPGNTKGLLVSPWECTLNLLHFSWAVPSLDEVEISWDVEMTWVEDGISVVADVISGEDEI